MLEEKRRQALEDQQAARKPHIVGAHQVTGASTPTLADHHVETIVAINVVVEEPIVEPATQVAAAGQAIESSPARVAAAVEGESSPKPSPWDPFRASRAEAVALTEPVDEAPPHVLTEYRQNSLFGEDAM